MNKYLVFKFIFNTCVFKRQIVNFIKIHQSFYKRNGIYNKEIEIERRIEGRDREEG